MAGQYNKKLKVIDLFSGAGGMSIGFENAGFEIISSNEFNKDIALTYIKNHPKTNVIVGDIKNIKSNELIGNHNDVDVIIGGPPCQGFSMAGNRIRKTTFLGDNRNELFKEFYRVVKDLQPKIFVIENVSGILNMNDGKVKDEIFNLFTDLGYNIEVKILLAADYGVPQLRKRAFFIGNRIGINSSDLFPVKTHGINGQPYVTVEESIFDLPEINVNEGTYEMDYNKKAKSSYQKNIRKKSKKIYNHIAPNHSDKIINLMKIIKEGEGRNHLPINLQTKSVHSGAYGRLDRKKPCYTITTRFDTPSVGRVTHPILNRSLTAREAARLQSFPDTYKFYGSKSSIGTQIGNAVPPLLSNAIAKNIYKFLINNYDGTI